MAELRVEYVPVEELVPDERNPKDHDLGAVHASIARFGYIEPVVVDERTGKLVAGHGRGEALLAAERDGDQEPPEGVQLDAEGRWCVPAVRGWASRSDDDARAALVALNRTTELGGWDLPALSELLADLHATEGGLDGTGYDGDDLDALLEELGELPGGGGGASLGEHAGALTDAWGAPPFTVLDARRGYWQERKREWLALGLRGELGRDPSLLGSPSEVDEETGRARAGADGELVYDVSVGATSVFDPVLTELLYRWCSPAGARILDPFAGGATRGIVAGVLGRTYHGVDLAERQVAANREQAAALWGSAPPADAYTEGLTPVEEAGRVWVKRDDLYRRAGHRGGKVRSCWALLTAGEPDGVVTAGSRHSPQVAIVAGLAQALGLPCRVHVPSGEATTELEQAAAAGAEVVRHRPGYNTVIVKRARDDAAERGWLEVPFGMETPVAVEHTAAQAANVPEEAQRVVVPVGSGMSLAGVLAGLHAQGRAELPVLGVVVGADPTERLESYAPDGWQAHTELVDASWEYAEELEVELPGGLHLDPHYEAKCAEHLEPGDLLWVVGHRAATRPAGSTVEGPEPAWHVGDATELHTALDDAGWHEPYDMVLTCPPYYDLEVYSDDDRDLANAPDAVAFHTELAGVLADAAGRLHPNRFLAVVLGEARGASGELYGLVAHLTTRLQAAGLHLYNDAVLVTPVGSLAVRADRHFRASRKLGRTHQYVLLFWKGDPAEVQATVEDWPVRVPDLEELL